MKSLVLSTDMCTKKVTGEYKAHDECSHEKTIFNLVDPINLESL